MAAKQSRGRFYLKIKPDDAIQSEFRRLTGAMAPDDTGRVGGTVESLEALATSTSAATVLWHAMPVDVDDIPAAYLTHLYARGDTPDNFRMRFPMLRQSPFPHAGSATASAPARAVEMYASLARRGMDIGHVVPAIIRARDQPARPGPAPEAYAFAQALARYMCETAASPDGEAGDRAGDAARAREVLAQGLCSSAQQVLKTVTAGVAAAASVSEGDVVKIGRMSIRQAREMVKEMTTYCPAATLSALSSGDDDDRVAFTVASVDALAFDVEDAVNAGQDPPLAHCALGDRGAPYLVVCSRAAYDRVARPSAICVLLAKGRVGRTRGSAGFLYPFLAKYFLCTADDDDDDDDDDGGADADYANVHATVAALAGLSGFDVSQQRAARRRHSRAVIPAVFRALMRDGGATGAFLGTLFVVLDGDQGRFRDEDAVARLVRVFTHSDMSGGCGDEETPIKKTLWRARRLLGEWDGGALPNVGPIALAVAHLVMGGQCTPVVGRELLAGIRPVGERDDVGPPHPLTHVPTDMLCQWTRNWFDGQSAGVWPDWGGTVAAEMTMLDAFMLIEAHARGMSCDAMRAHHRRTFPRWPPHWIIQANHPLYFDARGRPIWGKIPSMYLEHRTGVNEFGRAGPAPLYGVDNASLSRAVFLLRHGGGIRALEPSPRFPIEEDEDEDEEEEEEEEEEEAKAAAEDG